MIEAIERKLLVSYSRGEVTRREIEERVGRPVSFGALLEQLHANDLPLPRIPSDPRSAGVRLVKQLSERSGRRAG